MTRREAVPDESAQERPAKNSRFRPGTTGQCEAQLCAFTGSSEILHDDHARQLYWVAAESLDAALRYMRLRDSVLTGLYSAPKTLLPFYDCTFSTVSEKSVREWPESGDRTRRLRII